MDISKKTSLGLIKATTHALNGKFTKAFVGALVYLAPMVLLCLIPYVGWALSVVLYGHLTVGYIKYMKQLLKGEEVKLYTIFELNKNFGTITFLGAILVLLVLLGSILFIIPGIIVIAFYSMSLHVIEQEKSTSVMETLRKSSSLMEGNKVNMLSYKVMYYLGYAFLVLVFGVLMLFIDKLYLTMPFLSVTLVILIGVLLTLLFATITAYFFASNELFYTNVLNKPVKKATAEVKTVVEETKPQTQNDDNKELQKPKTTKKPAAKKPSQTATKKPAAKK